MQLPLALVWDNDPAVRGRVGDVLTASGFQALLAAAPHDALEFLRSREVVLIVAGVSGVGGATYDVLERSARLRPTAILAVLEGDGESHALDVARVGALELLPRPPRPERLQALAVRALALHGTLEELRRLRADSSGPGGDDRILGRSEAIERVRAELTRLTNARGPVLIVGERGSGRAHAARVLHGLSGADVPFVALEEAHVAGQRVAGTAFVRDVDRWSWADQATLVASLQTTPGARLVATTALDPAHAGGDVRLHPALVEAFGGAIVRIPPLRERREDVALLARSFVDGLRRLNGLPPIALEAETIATLERHAWPGNVKELRDAVETAVILAADGAVRVRDLPESVRGSSKGAAPGVRADRRFRAAKRSVVDAFERSYLTDLLSRHGGNVTGAAEHAGMLRSALQRLLRKHDLRSSEFRAPFAGRSTHDAS